MKKNTILLYTLICFSITVVAQNVDLEGFKKVNFKVNGGVNANSTYYDADFATARAPFTYLLSGNLSLSAFNFSMPLSYTITNQGNNLNYTVPFNFNRFSLMPKYKWVKAYLGDASLSFSPYTLSGHPFRGVGLELTPKGPFKISMMGGQLLKAVEATEGAGGLPVFERMGYGTKMGFERQKYKIEFIGFYAKDNINSIASGFDVAGVTPKENLVGSLFLNTSLVKNANFTVEYATSVFSDDTRAQTFNGNAGINKLINRKENTTILKAFRTNINYTIYSSNIGLSYERIDPNYRTLGALFFNNDLENITFNFARPLLNNRVTIATNLGYQRDDLKLQKKQNTKRIVGSVNATCRITDKLNLTGSYSNFSTYTNKNLNQFNYINDVNINPADTLNYRQLSQTASANLAYSFGKQKNQNINFNYNISGQANEQGGLIRKGQASNLQNYNLTHAINFKASKIGINTSVNYTLNTIGSLENASKGASASVSKKFLKEALNTNVGVLYNGTDSQANKSSVFGLRFNSSYMLLKKHNFTLSAIKMFRNANNTNKTSDFTLNFNYNYSF
jgi:hypothetical protein